MAQTLLAFDHHPADPRSGFELGWDHARHGVVPPPAQLHDGNPLRRGWQAGQAAFGQRTLPATRFTRQWLQLRLHAWLRARSFELMQLTPNYLRQIDVARCPITRQPLQHGSGTAADASIDRVRDDAGYAAGNLAVMSAAANRAKGSARWHDALVMVQHAQGSADGLADGLDAAAWSRLAVLMSFVTPLPHDQAARLPMRLLPPNRLRLLNPVQGLQALLTHEGAHPGWCRRLRPLADALPGEALRVDFNLLLNALLPRLIEASRAGGDCRMSWALEDAWSDALVQRRWQRFALQLDEPQVEALLRLCARHGLGQRHWEQHGPAQATEGWALESGGWIDPQHAASKPWPGVAANTAAPAADAHPHRHHPIALGRQRPVGRPQPRRAVEHP